MGLIIDTCIFIQTEKLGNNLDYRKWSNYGNVYMSAITATELLVGVHYANTEARKLKRSAYVEAILARLPVLDFTLETARIHSELLVYLKKKGQEIGAHDLIIAATAIEHGFPLLTYNLAEFKRVPGLRLLN